MFSSLSDHRYVYTLICKPATKYFQGAYAAASDFPLPCRRTWSLLALLLLVRLLERRGAPGPACFSGVFALVAFSMAAFSRSDIFGSVFLKLPLLDRLSFIKFEELHLSIRPIPLSCFASHAWWPVEP